MIRRLPLTFVLATVACLATPGIVAAQSAIAGVVRDTTGAVLPGVTVEASSPALIEGVRTAVTDAGGQYRVVDLRPGTYAVTFTLPGFTTVRREGIVLEANFTAPISVEMRVGALEETITVTGATPVVDVQSTSRREVVTRDLLETLPTGRDFQTIGNTAPAVSMGRYDVGGSSTVQQGTLVAFGSRGEDFTVQIDGMSGGGYFLGQWFGMAYHNDGAYQEMAVSVSGSSAETQTGGVVVNMVPRTGGNAFSGDGLVTFANSSMQSQNIDDRLRERGLTTPGGLDRQWDTAVNVGGPILRDRLWYYAGVRYWGFGQVVPDIFWADGRQAIDRTALQNVTTRITNQVRTTRITGMFNYAPRQADFFGIENRGGTPESYPKYPNKPYIAQVRTTTPVSSRLLLETGFTRNYWWAETQQQDSVRLATCFAAFAQCAPGTDYGDIRKQDLVLGMASSSHTSPSEFRSTRNSVMGTLSYVTGAHNLKIGVSHAWGGHRIEGPGANGHLVQRYRQGVPDSVQLLTQPSLTHVSVDREIGLYVQDSWTRGRLTLNPGLRFDHIKGSVRDQCAPAGRFLPERCFTRADYPPVPSFTDISPRFGVAFDVFGDGKTALKGSVGMYVQQLGTDLPSAYNPMGGGTDVRTWTDLNGDDIAQENELGPSTNLNFGLPANVTEADPNLTRPYHMLYNLGIQRELRPGLSASVNYYQRRYYREWLVENRATTHADYFPIEIVDPRGNAQTITIYSITPEKLGVIDNFRRNSTENRSIWRGVDVSMTARLATGTQLQGGVTTGAFHDIQCEVDNPNGLRFCDSRYPFQAQFKLSGVHPLPFGFRVSGLFQTMPGVQAVRNAGTTGRDFDINYSVGRAIAPALVQPTVNVRLNEPGSQYLDRVNQLDLSVSREFRANGVRVRPQVELFNALNSNPVIRAFNAFGPNLLRPQDVLNPRLLRVNVRLFF